jgi:competence protein ComEA
MPMLPDPALPPRPLPPRRPGAAVSAWLQWFGLGRLFAGAASVLIVIAGAIWLLQSPDPSTESGLPLADGSAPPATLPPPSTAPAASTTTAAPALSSVVVHVAGAVQAPGVFELSAAMRVADAVAAAGGPLADGDLDALNLAASLVDGQRIYVPHVGEVDPAGVPSGGSPAAGSGGDAAPGAPTGPLDLNTATAADLETLPGVGPATAAAIVEDRDRNGPFASVDDLDRVPGIGPAKLAALRDQVTV